MPERLRVIALAGTVLTLLVLMLGNSTAASWTSSATIPGVQVQTGVLDVQVGGRDLVDDLTGLTGMDLLPGDHVETTLTVTNAGSVPLDFSVTLAGDGGDLIGALSMGMFAGDCSGPIPIHSLAPGESAHLCVRVALRDAADPSVAGAETALTLMVSASNGGWTDSVPLTGSTLSAIHRTPPTLRCASGLLLGVQSGHGATAYRLLDAAGHLVRGVAAADVANVLGTVFGVVSVQAVFGSDTWVSEPATCG